MLRRRTLEEETGVKTTIAHSILTCFVLASASVFAQVGFPPPPPKVSPAAGVIDMHVHPAPDVFGRALTDIELATVARRKGMKGIVLKNHVVTTADRAAIAMEQVPGIEIWGGIVLNKSVGGINPSAVEWMHRMSGSRGKVVWLPTFDSDKHVKTLVDKNGSGLVVAPGGKVTPEMEDILKIIARENLVLATGHVHAEEVVAVTKRARELGVKNILVTHGLTNIPGLSMEQAREVAKMGAMIEICYLQFMTGPDAQYAWMKHWNKVATDQVLVALKEVGADHLVVSTDLGQQGMMMPPDGVENAIGALRAAGVSQADVDKMMKRNPARLLGLEN
jgi:microsomal dipeptidase-like Zn-dependent dipeptidase